MPQLTVAISSIPNAGYGLFTLETLKEGQFIGFYIGEFITKAHDEEQYNLRVFYDKQGDPSYIFNLFKNKEQHGFVDAKLFGNITRFANHKQKPNADVVQVSRKGVPQLMFRAKRKILMNEEIFINYGPDFFNN